MKCPYCKKREMISIEQKHGKGWLECPKCHGTVSPLPPTPKRTPVPGGEGGPAMERFLRKGI